MAEGWSKSICGILDKNSRDVDLDDQVVPGEMGKKGQNSNMGPDIAYFGDGGSAGEEC
jgi:hypothetical protein